MSVDDAAQFLKNKRKNNRNKNKFRQTKDDADWMKLSDEERTRFDNVNELWKVNSSVIVANSLS